MATTPRGPGSSPKPSGFSASALINHCPYTSRLVFHFDACPVERNTRFCKKKQPSHRRSSGEQFHPFQLKRKVGDNYLRMRRRGFGHDLTLRVYDMCIVICIQARSSTSSIGPAGLFPPPPPPPAAKTHNPMMVIPNSQCHE